MINTTFSDRDRDVDKQIRELLSSNPMPGNISLVYQKNPSLFDAIEVGNRKTQLLVVKDDNKVVGFQTRSLKDLYINGQVMGVGYLGNLRIDTHYQKRGILKSGMDFLKKNDSNRFAPFYFSTIISANKKALNILTKPRQGGLSFIFRGNYITKAVMIFDKKKNIDSKYKIVRGSRENIKKIVNFLNHEGRNKNFYPHYRLEDFNSGTLRDFKIEDFYVAIKDDDIVGVIGKWDQGGFKQNIIGGYSFLFKVYKTVHNFVSGFSRIPKIPAVGEKINYLYLSFIATKDNDPDIFNFLLKSVYNDLVNSDYLYLVIGLHQDDKLLKSLKGFSCLTYRSNLYINFWQGDDIYPFDNRVPYIELSTI
jgi:hypothetical protein